MKTIICLPLLDQLPSHYTLGDPEGQGIRRKSGCSARKRSGHNRASARSPLVIHLPAFHYDEGTRYSNKLLPLHQPGEECRLSLLRGAGLLKGTLLSELGLDLQGALLA